MLENRLNGFALLNIHREIEISIDDVIDKLPCKAR